MYVLKRMFLKGFVLFEKYLSFILLDLLEYTVENSTPVNRKNVVPRNQEDVNVNIPNDANKLIYIANDKCSWTLMLTT